MGTVQTREAHFVEFYSPGTFVSETSEEEIGEWDARKAMAMATDVKERYGARPFGFRFRTRVVTVPDDVPIKTLKESGIYYFNGRTMTLEDVERELPNETILISNMRGNDERTIVTGPKTGKGNYRWTHAFRPEDVLLDADGNVEAKGDGT